MQTFTAIIQTISLIVLSTAVLAAVVVVRRWRETWPFAIMPAAWAAFGVVYYVLLLTGRFTPQALLAWGAVHRLMAAIMTLGAILTIWMVMAAPPVNNESDGDDE